jgi:hypothetical protein
MRTAHGRPQRAAMAMTFDGAAGETRFATLAPPGLKRRTPLLEILKSFIDGGPRRGSCRWHGSAPCRRRAAENSAAPSL